jgi:endonuclease/exonuclease/phosphatase family metal-dependent hydrolase
VAPYTVLLGDFNLNVAHPSQAKVQPEPVCTENAPFCANFRLKSNFLPRQARDKHGEPGEKRRCSQDLTLSYIQAIAGLQQLMPAGKNTATCPATAPQLTIDYIFTGGGLVHLGGEVVQQEEPPSDHLPVIGRFSLS